MWRHVQERRQRGDVFSLVVELRKVRIQGLPRNTWNGEPLTRMRTLSSIEKGLGEEGTKVRLLSVPTARNLTSLEYEVPQAEYVCQRFVRCGTG